MGRLFLRLGGVVSLILHFDLIEEKRDEWLVRCIIADERFEWKKCVLSGREHVSIGAIRGVRRWSAEKGVRLMRQGGWRGRIEGEGCLAA